MLRLAIHRIAEIGMDVPIDLPKEQLDSCFAPGIHAIQFGKREAAFYNGSQQTAKRACDLFRPIK